ncbi:hypothetical protein [Pseudomonas chlororaphis]|uniref:hypothetical protein n=1 Tax=Pseudomonas chlororaphis TaxID=587753 RepID=UPI0023667875|nr:hypothetical protein [Pseudomonas chlororaphis]WDH25046.1 hypothetical protein PUP50_12485 [Pseudomonas chlororaphis]
MKNQFEGTQRSEPATQECGWPVVVEQSLANRWGVTMKKCERSGLLYAAGFVVIS